MLFVYEGNHNNRTGVAEISDNSYDTIIALLNNILKRDIKIEDLNEGENAEFDENYAILDEIDDNDYEPIGSFYISSEKLIWMFG